MSLIELVLGKKYEQEFVRLSQNFKTLAASKTRYAGHFDRLPECAAFGYLRRVVVTPPFTAIRLYHVQISVPFTNK